MLVSTNISLKLMGIGWRRGSQPLHSVCTHFFIAVHRINLSPLSDIARLSSALRAKTHLNRPAIRTIRRSRRDSEFEDTLRASQELGRRLSRPSHDSIIIRIKKYFYINNGAES